MKIEDFRVITNIQVQWGEMDAYRHVNNVNYVRWGETARIDYLKALGFVGLKPEKMAYAPVLGFQSVKYIVPVVYPDQIKIGTTIEELKDDRIILKSYYFSKEQKRLVAIKTHEVVFFDYNSGSKIMVPQEVKIAIEELESSKRN